LLVLLFLLIVYSTHISLKSLVNFLVNTKSEMALRNIWATCYHALTCNICIKTICGNNLQRYAQSKTYLI